MLNIFAFRLLCCQDVIYNVYNQVFYRGSPGRRVQVCTFEEEQNDHSVEVQLLPENQMHIDKKTIEK